MGQQPYSIDRSKIMMPEEARHLLTTSEAMAALDLQNGRRIWIIRSMFVSLALRTGMRIAEIANLKHGDIHLSGRDNYLTVTKGKGNKRRDIYCSDSLTKSLKDFIAIKKRWNEPHGPDDYFLSHQGKQYTTTALDYQFRDALKKAGLPVSGWKDGIPPWKGREKIPGYHPHTCRHTHATVLLQDTGDLRAVQITLGHSNISMTAHYADVIPQRRQELANKLSI
jgi:site-specific recombinase XerD